MRDWHQWHKMLRDRCARLVRDAAAIGARWCEIARDAARSVRDGGRSVRVPRNLVSVRECHVTCTDTHITHRWRKEAAQTKCTLRKKIAQGSARGQCPVVLYERKGGREQQDGGRAEKRSGQKAAGRNRKRPSYVGGTESSVKNLNM